MKKCHQGVLSLQYEKFYQEGKDLVLASSQLDLIISLFGIVAKEFWYPGTEQDPPVMSVFGYYHDAIKNFWLDALMIVVNKEFDARDYDHCRSLSRAFNRISGSVHRLDVFIGRICDYCCLGTCDEVREKLFNYLEVSPHFCGLYAYLNILKQQDLIDDSKNPKQFFSELVMKILNHPGQSNLISNGLHRFWLIRNYMQISNKFGQLLTRHLSTEWILQQIEEVEVASSIEWGWAVLSLLKLYKNVTEINGIYSLIVIEKLNNGLAVEAMNLFIALYSSKAEYAFECDTELLSDSAVQTLVQVLESLLERLPLLIMQERIILRIYIDIWPHAILASQSLRVYGYEELVRGFFHCIESNELLPQERVSLIQSFCQEAADANNDALLDVALTLVEQSKIISMDDLEPIR
ncbi:hypothetical protein MIR68_011516 [Amoeboaphelidium protococcarum]|nr:hypothetical protein MIR68_011516 [Amoeboaphelidium protococcarum]